jgi:hypothetical protein
MPKTVDIVIEADAQFATGYALCMDNYRADFVEGRDRFKSVTSFRFIGVHGEFLARQEERGGHIYWYGFKRFGRRIGKVYLGRPHRLTLHSMEEAAARLATQSGVRESRTVPSAITSDWLTPPN